MKIAYFNLLKYFFVVLFLLTAIGKLLDNRGFAEVIATYDLLPAWSLLSVGVCVSLFELFLGLSILKNFQLKICALVTILVHIGYVGLASLTLYRGIEIKNCGCFGVFWARPLTLQTVVEDGVLLVISILFYRAVQTTGVKNV